MRVTLDKSRPYGTVHGTPQKYRISFEQDGLPFGPDGEVVREACNPEQLARLEGTENRKKAKPSVPPSAQKESTGDKPPAQQKKQKKQKQAKAEPAAKSTDDNQPLNLTAFVKGEIKAQPFAVIKAVRDRYHKVVSSVPEAVRYLIEEENIVRPEDADPKLYKVGVVVETKVKEED